MIYKDQHIEVSVRAADDSNGWMPSLQGSILVYVRASDFSPAFYSSPFDLPLLTAALILPKTASIVVNLTSFTLVFMYVMSEYLLSLCHKYLMRHLPKNESYLFNA